MIVSSFAVKTKYPLAAASRAGYDTWACKEIIVMQVILDLCVVPMGVGLSVSRYIAMCEREIKACGLEPHLHAYGTTIEGDWDEVLGAVKRCHEALHEEGVPRLSTTIKLGTRTDRTQTVEGKVRSVKEKLADENKN